MISQLILGTAVLYVITAAIRKIIVYLRIIHYVNKIPSPKPKWPYGHIEPFLKAKEEDYDQLLKEWLKGALQLFPKTSLLKFWTLAYPEVAIVKASAAEVILKNSKQINKSRLYDLLHPWLGLGLLTSTGKKWQNHRKMLTPSFHFKILADNFMPVFNEQAAVLVGQIGSMAGTKEFDISPFLARCTLDVICNTAMGVSIDAQKNHNSTYVKAVNTLSDVMTYRIARVWLYSPWIFKFSSLKNKNDEALKIVHGFTEKVIADRKELYAKKKKSLDSKKDDDVFGKKKHMAFLDTLLEAMDKGEGYLTDQELREEVDTFMFEGHDTTATGLTWTLFYLGWNPSVQEKLQEELNSVFQGDKNRDVTAKDLAELKYLESVIKEALRLQPPVPIYGRLLVEDINIDGYTIPKGVSVHIWPYIIHRDPKIFEDPETFKPERFHLEKDPSDKNPFAYVPFSAGPRNCIGQKFALMEEKVILSHFLRNYKVIGYDKMEDIKVSNVISRPLYGLKIRVETIA